jgi:hypothetical protein
VKCLRETAAIHDVCPDSLPARFANMKEGATSWSDYLGRRRTLRIVLGSALPAIAICLLLRSVPTSIAIGVIWLTALVVADLHFEAWPCPHCKKPFFRRGAWHNSFANSCLNCGLSKRAGANAGTDR